VSANLDLVRSIYRGLVGRRSLTGGRALGVLGGACSACLFALGGNGGHILGVEDAGKIGRVDIHGDWCSCSSTSFRGPVIGPHPSCDDGLVWRVVSTQQTAVEEGLGST
jgi:hypothetical protein